MAKLIKNDQVPDTQDMNIEYDSSMDTNLSLLPMEIRKNENTVKLKEKYIKNISIDNNIYNCNQTDVVTSHQEKRIINFFNWRIMLNKNGQLIIKGTLDSGHFARSKPINKRLTAKSIQSIFNRTYHLNGNLVDYWDVLPDYIHSKFFNGFPEDWENVIGIWKSFISQGFNSDFHWPTFEYMEKEKTQNAVPFKVHPCISCDLKCNSQILKIKNDNNIYDKTYLPYSTDFPSSSATRNVYNNNNNNNNNNNSFDKKNDNQLSHLLKEDKMDNSKDDRVNKIVTNLLQKNIPKKHISKLIEILGFDKNVLLSKVTCDVVSSTLVQSNEVINNFEKSYDIPQLKELTDSTKNNIEELHRTSRITVKDKQNFRTESEEINDMLLQRSNEENSEEFENNTSYDTIKPRIISDRILLPNQEVLVKRHKREQRRKRTVSNPITGNSRTFRKSMKNDKEIDDFSLGSNNIENYIKCNDPVDFSVSEDTDERKVDNMKYCCAENPNKRKSDADESKRKKRRNITDMIEQSTEIPKLIKTFIDTNQMVLQQRQNITSAHLDNFKSPVSENYCDTNVNENLFNDKLESIPFLNNTKEPNENVHQLISDVKDGSGNEINECNNVTKGDHQILKGTSMNEALGLKKSKLLSDWLPQVIFDSSFVNGYNLIFEGKLLNDFGQVINRKFQTYPIHKRLSATRIEDVNQQVYELVGNMDNSKHVVPKRLQKFCLYGCPLNINKFCEMWQSYKEAINNINKKETKDKNKTTEKLKVTTSSRGRKIFPPLNYWTGERVASKDEEIVYTAGSTPKDSNYSLIENKNNKSDVNESYQVNESFTGLTTIGTHTDNKKTKLVPENINTLSEIMDIKEKMYEQFNGLGDSKIFKKKNITNSSKELNAKLSPSSIVLKQVEVCLCRCDLQTNNQHKANRDNVTVLQSNKHSNQGDKKQQSSTKEINLQYNYYKNMPQVDDISSDDQIF